MLQVYYNYTGAINLINGNDFCENKLILIFVKFKRMYM